MSLLQPLSFAESALTLTQSPLSLPVVGIPAVVVAGFGVWARRNCVLTASVSPRRQTYVESTCKFFRHLKTLGTQYVLYL